MAKTKNKKADKPKFNGTVQWFGNIQIEIPGHGLKTLRTDFGGIKLQKANPNKELLVLVRDHVAYNEIDTGYIVRTKVYDDAETPYFGLKSHPDADGWGCFNYCDVIAWGYADGGLNDPTLFYSCQSTVEEEKERERKRAEKGMKTHAEKLAEMEAETEDDWDDFDDEKRRCVKFRIENGDMYYNAVVGAGESMTRGGTNLMHDAAKVFHDFRETHPEVTEMHFYTDDKVKIED